MHTERSTAALFYTAPEAAVGTQSPHQRRAARTATRTKQHPAEGKQGRASSPGRCDPTAAVAATAAHEDEKRNATAGSAAAPEKKIGDGGSSVLRPRSSVEKGPASPSTPRQGRGAVTFLELCLAFSVPMFVGVLLLLIFVGTGLLPTRRDSTTTEHLATLPDGVFRTQRFVALNESADEGADGSVEDSDGGVVLSTLEPPGELLLLNSTKLVLRT